MHAFRKKVQYHLGDDEGCNYRFLLGFHLYTCNETYVMAKFWLFFEVVQKWLPHPCHFLNGLEKTFPPS
jgi:hypothetical protein